ncbi:MAG: hypothetical protein V1734_04895 [Nanoarchaeota archaeon]
MKTTLVEVMENGSEERFDARSHSATVFYTGMGGGGSSSPSSMGGGGFGSTSPSSMGSGGRSSDFGRHSDMGCCDSGYTRPDPSGPLSRAMEIQIKPIEIDMAPAYKPVELDMPALDTNLLCKALENMDLPKVPSNIGSAGYSALPDYLRESTTGTMRLAEIATAGCPKVPSTLGCAGTDTWKLKDFDYRGQGLGIGTEIINVDREHKVAIKLYEDLDNRETRLTFDKFGESHKKKSTLLKMPWEKND